MYTWLQELMAAASRAGDAEGLDDDGNSLRNDLIGNLDSAEGGEGDGSEGAEGDSDGETEQNVQMEVSGKQSKGRGGRPLSPEEIRKLLEQGAQIKPAEGEGGAEGEGMYLTQLTGKQAQELEELREQLGEIGPASNHGRLVLMHGRNQDSYYAYDEWDYVLADYRRNGAGCARSRWPATTAIFSSRRWRVTPRCCRRCAATSSASAPLRIGWFAGWRTARNLTLNGDRVPRRAPDGRESRPARLQGAQKRSARRRHALPARHVGLHRRADPSRGAQGPCRRRRR